MVDPKIRDVIVQVNAAQDIEVSIGVGNLTQADAELWGILPNGTYSSRIGVIWDNNGKILVRRNEYPSLRALHLHFTAVNDPSDPRKKMNLSGRLRQAGVEVADSNIIFRDAFSSTVEARGIIWRFT
jgi:hypothetical protein